MKKYNVVNTMTVGNNTAVIINGTGEMFGKGTIILNDSGSSYEVMSVGKINGESLGKKTRNATLMVKGCFESPLLYV